MVMVDAFYFRVCFNNNNDDNDEAQLNTGIQPQLKLLLSRAVRLMCVGKGYKLGQLVSRCGFRITTLQMSVMMTLTMVKTTGPVSFIEDKSNGKTGEHYSKHVKLESAAQSHIEKHRLEIGVKRGLAGVARVKGGWRRRFKVGVMGGGGRL
ncbi:hypothetical protein KSS87_015712 [Heliosperma pusillum]|nr:hypothetical protein KSS87_015712 [Heliosperma pusillum]